MNRLLIITVLLLIAQGCASVQNSTYSPPISNKYANEVVIEDTYDNTWKKLISAASQTFFAIDNFEKDSGLMTLSFSNSDIHNTIDCGTFNGTKYTVHYLSPPGNNTIKLNGKMNLQVQELEQNKTRIRVFARYIVDMRTRGSVYNYYTGQYQNYDYEVTYSFDSNTTGSTYIQNNAPGTSNTRTCGPTGDIEKAVIKLIENI